MGTKKTEDIIVSIITLTYNHESYIRECLDGILMQQTSFKFELLIHDDASTDNTANIIREYEAKYPDIIKPIYQTENQYSKKVPIGCTYLYPRAQGKYIALCEGDDYWTDPLKLQKQVDFLEANDEYGCVYTAYETINAEGDIISFEPSKKHMGRSFSGDIFYELLVDNFPQTLTVLFRRELLNNNFTPPYNFDYTLFLSLAIQKKFHYLPFPTGNYRISPKGLVQSGELWRAFDFTEIKLYFYLQYIKNKKYQRIKAENKKIHKYFLRNLCSIGLCKKYHLYFLNYIIYKPIYIFLIPAIAIKNTLSNKFPRKRQ